MISRGFQALIGPPKVAEENIYSALVKEICTSQGTLTVSWSVLINTQSVDPQLGVSLTIGLSHKSLRCLTANSVSGGEYFSFQLVLNSVIPTKQAYSDKTYANK